MHCQETNWFVLTGGPSAGKTSLGLYLAYLGYRVVPESARLYTDLKMSEGLSVEEIRKDNTNFQNRVLEMKAEVEARIDPNAVWIFDRGIPDSLPYGVQEVRAKTFHRFRYRGIFFLESVGFQNDYFRTETAEEAQKLAMELEKAYEGFGYSLVRLGRGTLLERASQVRKQIEASLS